MIALLVVAADAGAAAARYDTAHDGVAVCLCVYVCFVCFVFAHFT